MQLGYLLYFSAADNMAIRGTQYCIQVSIWESSRAFADILRCVDNGLVIRAKYMRPKTVGGHAWSERLIMNRVRDRSVHGLVPTPGAQVW